MWLRIQVPQPLSDSVIKLSVIRGFRNPSRSHLPHTLPQTLPHARAGGHRETRQGLRGR